MRRLLIAGLLIASSCTTATTIQGRQVSVGDRYLDLGGVVVALPERWKESNPVQCPGIGRGGASTHQTDADTKPSPYPSDVEAARSVASLRIHVGVPGPVFGHFVACPALQDPEPEGTEVRSGDVQEESINGYHALSAPFLFHEPRGNLKVLGRYWYFPDMQVAIEYVCEAMFTAQAALGFSGSFCASTFAEVRRALDSMFVVDPRFMTVLTEPPRSQR